MSELLGLCCAYVSLHVTFSQAKEITVIIKLAKIDVSDMRSDALFALRLVLGLHKADNIAWCITDWCLKPS